MAEGLGWVCAALHKQVLFLTGCWKLNKTYLGAEIHRLLWGRKSDPVSRGGLQGRRGEMGAEQWAVYLAAGAACGGAGLGEQLTSVFFALCQGYDPGWD